MKRKHLKAFRKAVLKNVQWIGKHSTKKGEVEIGVIGDYEVTKGETFLEIRDKISVYRFNR